MGEGSKKGTSFRMFELKGLPVSSYRSTYMNSMVTTNQKPMIDTQKQRGKEHKQAYH